MSPPSVSVVVPVYNSETTLRDLVLRLEPVLQAEASKFELILVNDGSSDSSWKVVESLARDHAWIISIDLMRNYGQHNALLCGTRVANYQLIVTMDDDLQHPPEEIPKLLARLDEGFDVVYGAPAKEQHGWSRDLASRLTRFALHKATGIETVRQVSSFRAFRRSLRDAFASYRVSSCPSMCF